MWESNNSKKNFKVSAWIDNLHDFLPIRWGKIVFSIFYARENLALFSNKMLGNRIPINSENLHGAALNG